MDPETLTPEQCAKLAEAMGWDQFTKYLPDPFCYFGGANHRTQMISNCKLTPAGAWLVAIKHRIIVEEYDHVSWRAKTRSRRCAMQNQYTWGPTPEMAVALAALEVIDG